MVPVSGAAAFVVMSCAIGGVVHYMSDLMWITGTLLGAATLLLIGTFLVVDEPDDDGSLEEPTRRFQSINSLIILVLLVIAAALEFPRII